MITYIPVAVLVSFDFSQVRFNWDSRSGTSQEDFYDGIRSYFDDRALDLTVSVAGVQMTAPVTDVDSVGREGDGLGKVLVSNRLNSYTYRTRTGENSWDDDYTTINDEYTVGYGRVSKYTFSVDIAYPDEVSPEEAINIYKYYSIGEGLSPDPTIYEQRKGVFLTAIYTSAYLRYEGALTSSGNDAIDFNALTPLQSLLAANSDELYNAGGGDDVIRLPDRSIDLFYNSDRVGHYRWVDLSDFHGGDGNDTIYGGAQVEYLYGGNGNDRVFGGGGGDYLIGGAGADLLSGGDGFDTVMYKDASQGVVISVGNTSLNTGDAAGDVYDSIESFWGSLHSDMMFGSAVKDTLVGDGGDDNIFGGGGDDWLNGLDGNDLLSGGPGSDQLTGGRGADSFIFNWSEQLDGSSNTVRDYSSADGDRLVVNGGTVSAIDVRFYGAFDAGLYLGQYGNYIQLDYANFVTVEWHPTEVVTDFANAVVLTFMQAFQQTWSKLTQFYDASSRFDYETGSYANGSGWLYDVDQANGSDLRYFRNEFSINFTLTSQLGQYDDGRQWQDIYNNGHLATKTWIDLENTGSWARFTDTYDQSNGLLDSEVGSYDNGAGWLFDVDQTNVTWFRYFRNEFTSAFQLTRQIGQTDDGRIWDDQYDNGHLAKTQWTDAEDTQVWSTVTDTYGDYGNGHTVQRLYMFDDGSHAWQLI